MWYALLYSVVQSVPSSWRVLFKDWGAEKESAIVAASFFYGTVAASKQAV
jgi:hypothetical protein